MQDPQGKYLETDRDRGEIRALQQEIVIFLNFRDIISTFDCLVKDLETVRVISSMKDNKQILKHREMLARRYFNQESGRI